jgi:DNA replication protein DnaC
MVYELSSVERFKRHWLLNTSNIPHRFLGLEPSDFESGFPAEIVRWQKKVLEGKVVKAIGGLGLTGTGLLFDGAPGLGKTTHAVTSIMEVIRNLPDDQNQIAAIFKGSPEDFGFNSRPVYYMTFPEFLSRKKAMIDADPDVKRQMHLEMEGFHGRAADDRFNVRILVLDDLGKEYGSKYDDTSFDEILRSRYDKGLPTIVTTNVLRENWAKQYGDAMGSFAHEAFNRVSIIGKDLRK